MAYRVLIIDDDVDFVEFEKILLEKNGYEVITAFDGQEGYRKALEENPDIILLDVVMTTEDEGLQIAHRIKSQVPIPIVILTSLKRNTGKRGDEIQRNEFPPDGIPGNEFPRDELPIEEYIEKPIKPEKLISTIQRILRKAGQYER